MTMEDDDRVTREYVNSLVPNMEQRIYKIKVIGCDATTEFELLLSVEEFEIVNKVVVACNEKSDGGCQPEMSIEAKE